VCRTSHCPRNIFETNLRDSDQNTILPNSQWIESVTHSQNVFCFPCEFMTTSKFACCASLQSGRATYDPSTQVFLCGDPNGRQRRPCHSHKLSFTAMAIACSDPKYRSVVGIDECPSRNLICSKSPPFLRQSFAQVRRRPCAPKWSIPICFYDCSATDQIAQSPSSSRRIFPDLETGRSRRPSSILAAVTKGCSSFRTRSPWSARRFLYQLRRDKTGTRGAMDDARQEAYSGADHEPAAAG
jgi:hypothetical protein